MINKRFKCVVGICLVLCGCSSGTSPNAYYPAVSVVFRLLTTSINDFKGTGTVHFYQSTYDRGWEALLYFARNQKTVDGSKIISKSQKSGWILTEKAVGGGGAMHDAYFIEALNDSQVQVEIVSRTAIGAKTPFDPERSEKLQEDLARVLKRVD